MINRKMKFLIVTGYAPSLINFRAHLLKRIINENYQVTAISRVTKFEYKIKEKLTSIGIDLLPIYITHKITSPILEVISILCIAFRIIQIRPDKILVYSPKPIIYTGIAVRCINKFPLIKKFELIALVTGLGNTFSYDGDNNLRDIAINSLAKFSFKRINKIIFQNDDDESFLKERKILDKNSKIYQVNGSGVDLKYFSYYPKNEQKQKVFLMLSRLIIDKGVNEYIKAAELIKKIYPEVIFNLAGMEYEGPRAITLNEIKEWERRNIINYLGLLNNVKESLINTDFFVLPSFYREGIPRSLMEAMAIGRPLITTNSTGCKECILDNINGFMVPPRDYNSLYIAMKKLINQDYFLTKNMGYESRLLAEKKFNVNDINNQMISIFKI